MTFIQQYRLGIILSSLATICALLYPGYAGIDEVMKNFTGFFILIMDCVVPGLICSFLYKGERIRIRERATIGISIKDPEVIKMEPILEEKIA